MKRKSKEITRTYEALFMGVLSLFCLSLSLFRFYYSGTKVYLFLNWNLFLAAIPWLLTSAMLLFPKLQKSRWSLLVLLGTWLLFFPNAPYILTDLFHLRRLSIMPIWFDLVLILSFAWTGLLFGFMSLWDIEKVLQTYLKKTQVTIASIGLLFIASLGIYLGRFLRWNSWDVVTEPLTLVYDLGSRVVYPLEHPRTWGVTISMGLFLSIVYLSFSMIRKRDDH